MLDQSPNAMKGLLFGVWYSMLAIKYTLINVLDDQFHSLTVIPWNIYHGIKGFFIFLSIIAFSFVCAKHRFRERSETDNNHTVIEEMFERELLLNSNEDFSGSSSNNDED